MAVIARRFTKFSNQTNPHLALRSVLFFRPNSTYSIRSFRNNAACCDDNAQLSDDESDPPFQPYNPEAAPVSKPSKPGKIPKRKQNKHNINKKNKEKSQPDQFDESRWTLDRKDKTPLHSSLPFDFQYSYSEVNPNLTPIGFREKKFSPFGPKRLDRVWTGWSAPAPNTTPVSADGNEEKSMKSREEILGDPLTEEEVQELVEKYGREKCNRQINLGKGGVTHNMLDDIHNHWKRAEAVRIKCLGVPTIDMDNVCFHLEDKTGGKIISRRTNILILYRGRHYDPKQRPVIPLMLWKPHEPIYPKLTKNVVDGLTIEETKEMRNRGLNTPALTNLTKNGVYVHLVQKVREAFTQNELVRIDCKGMEMSDYKKIGAKLKDLVPCVLLLFKNQQIVIWRGKNYKSASSSGPVLETMSGVTINSLMLVKESPLVPSEILSRARIQSSENDRTPMGI